MVMTMRVVVMMKKSEGVRERVQDRVDKRDDG
jgi:hypothetical protein